MRELIIVLRELTLGMRVLTPDLRVIMFCERANRSFKEANPRSEGIDSRFKGTNVL